MNKLQEKFIEKYKELEDVIQNEYALSEKDSPVYFLANLSDFSHLKTQINYCREVRNFLQHEKKINGEFAVTPSQEMINLLCLLIDEVKYPLKAKDIMTKKENIFYKSKNDYVVKSIMEMDTKSYTHIPIIENGKVVGIFSSNSIISYMKEYNIYSLDEDLTFAELGKIGFSHSKSERYLFISKEMRINRIKELFNSYYEKAKRIGMMIVTDNGKKEESMLGIITPYDLLKEIK